MAVATDYKQQQNLLALEVKVLSARSLKGRSSLVHCPLRPYVALSVAGTADLTEDLGVPPSPPSAKNGGVVYRSRVHEHGGENPTWGDTVRLPLDPSFLHHAGGGAVNLFVLSKRRLAGPARLGWCRIPACDVNDGLRPPSSVRRLSYALRSCQHGGRGHGVVDLAVRLVGPLASSTSTTPPPANVAAAAEMKPVQVVGVPPAAGWAGEVAIGIPVEAFLCVETAAGRKARGRGAEGGARGGQHGGRFARETSLVGREC